MLCGYFDKNIRANHSSNVSDRFRLFRFWTKSNSKSSGNGNLSVNDVRNQRIKTCDSLHPSPRDVCELISRVSCHKENSEGNIDEDEMYICADEMLLNNLSLETLSVSKKEDFKKSASRSKSPARFLFPEVDCYHDCGKKSSLKNLKNLTIEIPKYEEDDAHDVRMTMNAVIFTSVHAEHDPSLEKFELLNKQWNVYTTEDGYIYYFCSVDCHSQWHDPRVFGYVDPESYMTEELVSEESSKQSSVSEIQSANETNHGGITNETEERSYKMSRKNYPFKSWMYAYSSPTVTEENDNDVL